MGTSVPIFIGNCGSCYRPKCGACINIIMKLNEILRESQEQTFARPFEMEDGSEVMLTIHYDVMPEQKQTRMDPAYPAEIEINSILTKSGVDVTNKLGRAWVAAAIEDIEQHERERHEDTRY